MSKKGRVRRLVEVLKRTGFYGDDSDIPENFDQTVGAALESFMCAPGGEPVERVLNALKVYNPRMFGHIPKSTKFVSGNIKRLVENLILQNGIKLEKCVAPQTVPVSNDINLMQPWEIGGEATSFA